MRARLPALLLMLCCAALSACGTTGSKNLASTPTAVPLVERNYELVEYGLSGESCQLSVLGIGIGDTSYATAIRRLRAQIKTPSGGELQLVNVVEDSTFNFYLLAWEACTVISADLAVLKEPAAEVQVRTEVHHSPAPVLPSPMPPTPSMPAAAPPPPLTAP